MAIWNNGTLASSRSTKITFNVQWNCKVIWFSHCTSLHNIHYLHAVSVIFWTVHCNSRIHFSLIEIDRQSQLISNNRVFKSENQFYAVQLLISFIFHAEMFSHCTGQKQWIESKWSVNGHFFILNASHIFFFFWYKTQLIKNALIKMHTLIGFGLDILHFDY